MITAYTTVYSIHVPVHLYFEESTSLALSAVLYLRIQCNDCVKRWRCGQAIKGLADCSCLVSFYGTLAHMQT